MHATDDKTPQKNTRLYIRKKPIDETEKSIRESKYSKDNTNKYPHPWLDGIYDPKGHMIEKYLKAQ